MSYQQSTAAVPLKTIRQDPIPTYVVDLSWVDTYWSEFFGCTVEQFCDARQTQLVESANITGPWAFARQGNWVVALPKAWQSRVADVTATLQAISFAFRPGALPKQEALDAIFTLFPVAERFGPALVYLHTAPPPLPVAGVTIRPLTLRDSPQIVEFAAMTSVPWCIAEPDIWKKVFGLFVDGQLVASCAMRVWGALLAEVYVDTAPAFRGRGYGRAITHAMLQWIHTSTPYYAESVAELSNVASIRLLSRLGGLPYGYVVMSF